MKQATFLYKGREPRLVDAANVQEFEALIEGGWKDHPHDIEDQAEEDKPKRGRKRQSEE